MAATLQDWLDEVERVQLMLRLSARLQRRHFRSGTGLEPARPLRPPGPQGGLSVRSSRLCRAFTGGSAVAEGSDVGPEFPPLLALVGGQLDEPLVIPNPCQVRTGEPVVHPFVGSLWVHRGRVGTACGQRGKDQEETRPGRRTQQADGTRTQHRECRRFLLHDIEAGISHSRARLRAAGRSAGGGASTPCPVPAGAAARAAM